MAAFEFRSPYLLSLTFLLLLLLVLSFSPFNKNSFSLISLSSSSSSSKLHNHLNTSTQYVKSEPPLPSPPASIVPDHAKKKSNSSKIEEQLARARAAIHKAIVTTNYTSDRQEIYIPRGNVYRNPYAFHQLSSLNSCHCKVSLA